MDTSLRFIKNFKLIFSVMLLTVILSAQVVIAQQNMQEVVYLKNGSIIRGIIIEQVPSESVKIQTSDGNVFFYRMEDIEKITKEPRVSIVPLGKSAFLFNPLGFLQFGPIIQGEFRVAGNTFVVPHLRISSLGVLYHGIVQYDEISLSSMAVGIGAKQFFGQPSSSNRFYAGVFAEHGWGSGKNDVGESYESELEHTYTAVMSNFGYRWRFPSKFFVNLGLFAGSSTETSDKKVSPSVIEYSLETYFLGMLELSFGWEK